MQCHLYILIQPPSNIAFPEFIRPSWMGSWGAPSAKLSMAISSAQIPQPQGRSSGQMGFQDFNAANLYKKIHLPPSKFWHHFN